MCRAAAPKVACPEGYAGKFGVKFLLSLTHLAHPCLGSSSLGGAAASSASSPAAKDRLVGGAAGASGKKRALRMLEFGAPSGSQNGSASSDRSLFASVGPGPNDRSCSRIPTTGR